MRAIECAVIAAAGLGSRLGHGLPKCMLEIGGQTLLTRLINSLRKQVRNIHVVVGYREDLVISLCANQHRDVVIVRNPEYRTTNTVQSMALGAKACSGKTIFLDGDLIIDPSSLDEFILEAEKHEMLVGIARNRSENAVSVNVSEAEGCSRRHKLLGFTRRPGPKYEWANVVAGPSTLMGLAEGYVYEVLADYVPLPALELDLREVDTEADLDHARAFVATL